MRERAAANRTRTGSGKFITLEGGEGAGKSTQARLLAERLREAGHPTLLTREPGGTDKAEGIRHVLLSGRAAAHGPLAEAILFSVARDDHITHKIRPALVKGTWVVCDRFADSTRAYQGAAGVAPELIRALERLFVGETRPDLTLILDIPVDEGLKRATARSNGQSGASEPDRYEGQDRAFHEALREAFRRIAADEPDRCVLIDARRAESAVAEDIWEAVVERLGP